MTQAYVTSVVHWSNQHMHGAYVCCNVTFAACTWIICDFVHMHALLVRRVHVSCFVMSEMCVLVQVCYACTMTYMGVVCV